MRLILTSFVFATLFFAGCSDDDDSTAAGGSAGGGAGVSIPFPAVGLLSVGEGHACVNDATGVKCWGQGTSGELGYNNNANRAGPTAVFSVEEGAGTNADAASTANEPGRNQQAAYDADGDLFFPLAGVEAVDAGSGHTCALGYDMGLRCWGANTAGQVGRVRASTAAATVLADTQAFDVGVLVSGPGDSSTRAAGTLIAFNDFFYGVSSISTGGEHTCAIYDTVDNEGTVACWGRGQSGQLGVHALLGGAIGADMSADSPQPVVLGYVGSTSPGNGGDATDDLLTGIEQVAAGGSHTCALSDGEVYCWGAFANGQLGVGTIASVGQGVLAASTDAPVQVFDGEDEMDYLDGITQLVAGSNHTCALSNGGSVSCWGEYAQGQLGLGSLPSTGDGVLDSSTDVPRRVLGTSGSGSLSGIVQLAAGLNHTCALSNSQRVYCWGQNANGQLGTLVQDQSAAGTTTSDRPLSVVDITGDDGQGVNGTLGNVVGIAAGGNTTCALQSTGSVVCWGSNDNGALGLGATTLQSFGYPAASTDSYQPVVVRANAFSSVPYMYSN